MKKKILELLELLYGPSVARDTYRSLSHRFESFKRESGFVPLDLGPMTERDSFVITHGDQFYQEGRKPLEAFSEFARMFLEGMVTGIHLLPFSPSSSSEGSSIIDYREEVRSISSSYIVMADLFLNRCSAKNLCSQKFLQGEEASPDTTDFNYEEPRVLLEMLDTLLLFLQMGVQVIRLDSAPYLWKELGTACFNHPKSHAVVKIIRAILEEVAPSAVLVVGGKAPLPDTLSYFGEGDEAHLLCQSALPAILLDAFLRADSTHLKRWAVNMRSPLSGVSFFNSTAAYDGIGLLPVQGILSVEEITGLIQTVIERGGTVTHIETKQGLVPYELHANYFSALAESTLADDLRIMKFLASQAIIFALPGVPGICLYSLLGSKEDRNGGAPTIPSNRERFSFDAIVDTVSTVGTMQERLFSGFEELLRARVQEPAFHPLAEAQALPTPKEVFALLRIRQSQEGPKAVLCMANLHHKPIETSLDAAHLRMGEERYLTDLLTGDLWYPTWESYSCFSLELQPFEALWLAYNRRT